MTLFKQGKVPFLLMVLLVVAMACSQGTAQPAAKPPANVDTKPAAPPAQTAPGPAAQPGPKADQLANQQKIVFWSLREAMWSWNWQANKNAVVDNNYEVFIMDPDGNNQVNLTNNPARDLVPRLSPDGKKIVFVSDRKWEADNKLDDNYDLFVMDTDGSNVKDLTGHLAWDSMPCWSPDGKMIVFCSRHSSTQDIWVTDAEGHNFFKLIARNNSDVRFFPSWPMWSPDGKRITFNSFEEGTHDITMVEIDYDLVRQIVLNPLPENATVGKWSDTGNRKVVGAAINSSPWVKELKKITLNPTGYDAGASWSPDGTKLAYVSSRKEASAQIYDIYVMNADGSNPVNLTKSISREGQGAFNDWPSWSPDGKKITFVSDREGQPLDFGTLFKYAWQIYVMNADGSNVIRIINNNYAEGSPDWGNVPSAIAVKLMAPVSQLPAVGTPEVTLAAKDLDAISKARGKVVAVEGEVVDFGSNGDTSLWPVMLYFDNPNSHCRSYDEWNKGSCGTDFRVVISQKDFKKFPDIYFYYGKKIRVTGTIDYYRSAHVIMVNNPAQITFIK